MSRYIDADALIKEMSEKHRPNFHEDLKSYHMWIMWYWALKEAPSIDIVRCQDCKHWRTYETWSECELWTDDPYESAKTKTDDFCSFGERSRR